MALEKSSKVPTLQYSVQRLEHFQQRFSWDCGISCVLMLLSPEQRKKVLENFQQLCQEEGFGQSTWTIDLCYLLKRFDIKHCMYTIRRGVNESHRRHGYYNKIIELDAERVRKRFELAEMEGIRVVERFMSDQEILDHVLNEGPVIMLVDAGLLSCDLCKHNKLKADFRSVFGGAYRGHYVVVVGASARRWAWRDPALAPRVCAAPPPRLRRARAAAGTDADLILVYNHYR